MSAIEPKSETNAIPIFGGDTSVVSVVDDSEVDVSLLIYMIFFLSSKKTSIMRIY